MYFLGLARGIFICNEVNYDWPLLELNPSLIFSSIDYWKTRHIISIPLNTFLRTNRLRFGI